MESDLAHKNYVVIRDLSRRSFGGPFDRPGPGIAASRSLTPEPEIKVLEGLSKRDVQEAVRDPEIAALAPEMPTTLIRPRATDNASETESPAGTLWGLEEIGATISPMTGDGVTVAVLDTGIDRSHAAFAGKTILENDFTGAGNGDLQGHGTHCAGTIFGGTIDGKRIGVAPNVSQALIGKVLDNDGGGESSWLFSGIQWAFKEGANVLSMSLGFDFPGMVAARVADGWPVEAATSVALEAYRSNLRVFERLISMLDARGGPSGGMLIVAAAGNESKRDGSPAYEIAASLPSAAEGVLSVAALERTAGGLKPAAFSNTFPEISAPGVAIVSAQTGGGLTALNGTSMACPHVAGAACLWWEALRRDSFQQATPRSVEARLLASARTNRFAAGVDPTDCGVGLVAAP